MLECIIKQNNICFCITFLNGSDTIYAIAVYSYSPWSFTAAFSALAGDYEPEGVMPLKGIQ